MQVIEAQCASILVPHDHLHISQKRAFPRKRCGRGYRSGPRVSAHRKPEVAMTENHLPAAVQNFIEVTNRGDTDPFVAALTEDAT
jgi:hypothetical protein